MEGVHLEGVHPMNKYNKGVTFLLHVVNIYRKYSRLPPLKDKKDITITNSFQKILYESGRKPNKMWVDQGSEFYNRSMKEVMIG